MENEIKVNEYVRMKDGLIAKIISKDIDGHFIINRYYNGGRYLTELEIKNEVSKHSLKLVDLIQAGDYVNGCRVIRKEIDDSLLVNDKGLKYLQRADINSVLTKEIYETLSYKL